MGCRNYNLELGEFLKHVYTYLLALVQADIFKYIISFCIANFGSIDSTTMRLFSIQSKMISLAVQPCGRFAFFIVSIFVAQSVLRSSLKTRKVFQLF